MEKDISNNYALAFLGFESFLECFKEEASKNSIQVLESENNQLVKILIPIYKKVAEFKCKRNEEDPKLASDKIFENMSNLYEQVSTL